MNNKGQLGALSVIFGLIVFFILWAMFFAEWVSEWAQQMITDNSLVGIEAFLIANINLWIAIGVILGVLAFIYFGGGQQ